MSKKIYLIEELWNKIKDYLIHNIKKHGKHLKNDSNIITYNNILKSLPKRTIPSFGPRIIYFCKNNIKYIKYIFLICINKKKRFYKKVIEYLKLPDDYDSKYLEMDNEINGYYYSTATSTKYD